MTTKYFSIPFANSGDKTSIPDASQPSGSVSFEDGWTPDYEKDQATDPDAKDVSRQNENYFKFSVTESLKEIQEIGFKPYDPLVNYPIGASTFGSDGLNYKADIANGPATSVVNPVGDLTGTWINPVLDATRMNRSQFIFSSGDIIMTGGGWIHQGTVTRLLKILSTLTFTPGPAGSNPDSIALGANETHYVYIDDSAVVSSGISILTDSEIVNNTTPPVYDPLKQGWYNGNDRCIFYFRTLGTSAMLPFYHDGGDYVMYDTNITELPLQAVTTTWITIICGVPSFCQKANITIFTDDIITSGNNTTEVRTFGSAITPGHVVTRWKNGFYSINQFEMLLSSDQKYELRNSNVTGTLVEAYTNGWFFPKGI